MNPEELEREIDQLRQTIEDLQARVRILEGRAISPEMTVYGTKGFSDLHPDAPEDDKSIEACRAKFDDETKFGYEPSTPLPGDREDG